MSGCFTFKIKANFSELDFSDASIPLGQIAQKIATEAQKNIRTQTNLDGSAFKPLSVKTLKEKRRLKVAYPKRALYRKGIMYKAIHVYKVSKNAFSIGIMPRGVPPRNKIGQIHQEVGPVIRTFLGMNTKTINWAIARMDRWFIETKQKSVKRSYSTSY